MVAASGSCLVCRYAAGSRQAGTLHAVRKAVGPPQLQPGRKSCRPNNAIAWQPSLARPRKLTVYYNATAVTVGQVDSVVLSVVYVGSAQPALEELVLLLQVSAIMHALHAGQVHMYVCALHAVQVLGRLGRPQSHVLLFLSNHMHS